MNPLLQIVAFLIVSGLQEMAVAVAEPAKQESMDQRFVRVCSSCNLVTLEWGELAQQVGSPEVKEIGRRLVAEHGNVLKRMLALSKKKGFISTKRLGPRDRSLSDKLARLKGREFDRAFLRYIARAHQEAIALFE